MLFLLWPYPMAAMSCFAATFSWGEIRLLPCGVDFSEVCALTGFPEVESHRNRQQKTIRAVFHYTNMLLYRGYLLQEILQKANIRSPKHATQALQPLEAARKCLNSALKIAEFAVGVGSDHSYNAVYWVRYPARLYAFQS